MAPNPERLDELVGPFFMDATLRPNRSLRNTGYIALMGGLGLLLIVAGAFYWNLGAWPVLAFFGLEFLFVWLAFRISYRQGRLNEVVRVTPQALDVTRIHPTGHIQRWRLAPGWANVHIEDPVEHDSQVAVRSHGKTLILGAFLSPPERGEFAKALKAAIAEACSAPLPAT